MTIRTILTGIYITASVLLAGCNADSTNSEKTDIQEPLFDIKMKSVEEQAEMVENYMYEDYKEIFDEVLQEAKSYSLENEEREKWVIRTLTQEKMYFETDLSQEEILQLADWDMRMDETWREIANEKYGITFTKEEVENQLDEFTPALAEGASKKQMQAYADTLGLTLKELFYEYDRDYAVKMVIWEKLIPYLQKNMKLLIIMF